MGNVRMMNSKSLIAIAALMLVPIKAGASPTRPYDVVIRGGQVYDGLGTPPVAADVAILGDRIVKLGVVEPESGREEIDARGKAVAPGFINMLSWANESLMIDGRAMSDLKQGVTLEVMGEGQSMGPLSPAMRNEMVQRQTDIKFPVTWTTLDGYLRTLEKRGISPNVASFVGAETVRVHELGALDRPPTAPQLKRMQALVAQAMREGALGLGTSLIYAPGTYARTDELIALARTAGSFGGRYISHMRSEGDKLLEGVDELLKISRDAKIPAEIYHLKMAGAENWSKFDQVVRKVESARADGLDITADMYTYIAGATGFDASMPPWVQEGGYTAWAKRLRDPAIRARVVAEMKLKSASWENLYLAAGTPNNILLIGFGNPALKPLTGKTLTQVAQMRGTSPEDTIIDLVLEDGTRVNVAYFLMSEENVRKQIKLPWMSFGSDAEGAAPEGVFLLANPHPRAYGTFARLLGRYVRDEKLITLSEAIRRLTSLPAANLKIDKRGQLAPGYFADVVVFDPATIADKATFAEPHQYAVGVSDVIVNGIMVMKNGEHTGKTAGRVVRGPGWTGNVRALKTKSVRAISTLTR